MTSARESRSHRAVPLLVAALAIVAIGADVARIGFFADDFHFLDVARRMSLPRSLSGQYGIWPWFRPLSRELYFEILVAAGPAGLLVARALSLACVIGCGVLTWRVGRRMVGREAAGAAVGILLTYSFTKFLVAWASGFQDLLAMLLTLLAVDALLSDRPRLALGAAALAPFAKEPAFVVFPLLAVLDRWRGRRLTRADTLRRIGVFLTAVALHVIVRLTWAPTTAGLRPERHLERLPPILDQALAGFLSTDPAPGRWSGALAVLAAACAVVLLRHSRASVPAATPEGELHHGAAFVTVAAGLSLAPMLIGHALGLVFAMSYHAFPAAPWIALGFGRAATRLPRSFWSVALPLLVAWNVWSSGFAPPDLTRFDNWRFREWTWSQAVRFTTISSRLRSDLRRVLAVRPESLVVLYDGLPTGSYFQTEDGPATREALGDLTVRAFWVNDPAPDLRADRLAIIGFDPESFHLRRVRWSIATGVHRAMNAIIAGRGRAARAFVLYGAGWDSAAFDRAYLGAAAELLDAGPQAFRDALAGAGAGDTAGAAPVTIAEPIEERDPGLGAGMVAMLRRPLSARSHSDLADSLIARGVMPRAAAELRIAVALDPGRHDDHHRLVLLMARLGGTQEALAELQGIASRPGGGVWTVRAREEIARISGAPAP